MVSDPKTPVLNGFYQLVPQIGAHLYEMALRVMHENKMNLTHGSVY